MRILAAALLLLSSPQADEDLSATLKRDGWKAVEAIVAKGETSRTALQSAAASKDTDISFFANAGLAELDVAKEGEMALLASNPPKPDSVCPAFAIGKFNTWLEQRYRVDLNQFDPGPVSYVQFSGRIVSEGRPAVGKRIRVEVLEAVDDRGNRLEAPPKTLEHLARGESAQPGAWYSLAVAAPAAARSLKRIRLRIELTCERKRGEIVFDELTAGRQEKKSGAVSVKLISVLPSSGGEKQVTIEAQGASGHPWLDHTGIKLEGAKGKVWHQRGAHIGNKTDGVYYQFHFDDPEGAGEPKSLRFPAVTETYVRVIYVEFREVPLQ